MFIVSPTKKSTAITACYWYKFSLRAAFPEAAQNSFQ